MSGCDGQSGTADLPPVYRQRMPRAAMLQVLTDVEQMTHVLEVRVRHAGAQRAQPETPTLAQARQALLDGDVAGLQVRYTHDGKLWFDTLMAAPAGEYELIRVCHER